MILPDTEHGTPDISWETNSSYRYFFIADETTKTVFAGIDHSGNDVWYKTTQKTFGKSIPMPFTSLTDAKTMLNIICQHFVKEAHELQIRMFTTGADNYDYDSVESRSTIYYSTNWN